MLKRDVSPKNTRYPVWLETRLRVSHFTILVVALLLSSSHYSSGKATGNLKVLLKPIEAVDAGAKWRVDGGAWHGSGTIIRGLTAGPHTVSYKPIDGWKRPKSNTVDVVEGQTSKEKRKYKPVSEPPSPTIVAQPLAGPPPLEIQFSGDANDLSISSPAYSWSFGDGGSSSEQNPAYSYPPGTSPGAYVVTLTVTGSDGNQRTSTTPITITAGDVSAAEMISPAEQAQITVTDSGSAIAGASVVIPKGSVDAPVTITIGEDITSPSEWLGRQPLVELGPEGTTFDKPVSVTVPVSTEVANPENARIIAYDPALGVWSTDGITDVQYLGGADRSITFQTTHFTFFSTLDTWSVQDLGSLGGTTSYAFSINDNSKVTGYSYVFVAANWRHGFLWEDGNPMDDIHDTTDKHSYGFGINAANPIEIVGYTDPEDGTSNYSAFVWDSTNGMQDIGTLGGNSAQAWGINDSHVVVGQSTNGSGNTRAFRWTSAGGMTDLGTLGGQNAFAAAISSAGHIVGWSEDNGMNKSYSFRWTSDDGMVKLKQHSSSKYSVALGVNASGNPVGKAETSSGLIHAAFWTGTSTITDLGTLGGTSSVARSINDSDQIVGSSTTALGAAHAFGWDNTGTPAITDLNTLLSGGSGWVLVDAWDINNTGEVVGYGTLNGLIRAFLLKKV